MLKIAVKAKPEGYGVTDLIEHKKRGELGVAKRDYETVSEWKKAYRVKAKMMNEKGYRELKPKEFYRDIFPEGSMQSREHDAKQIILAT
ncbi:hypothetical protein [Clostridioides difficile]|uniref:hypothetical protein n=1 Tax=Clostridioides difficile TaxID=1496 RepID=UPI000BB16B97|nr:hypothetical protein [Clostridioides difficile]PBG42527.1 hypothetical protein BGU93_19235 [Clostridioides difficile]